MRLDVVRVSVEPVVVVGDHNVGGVPLHQLHQRGGGLLDGKREERAGLLVGGPPHHSRVVVAEEFEMANTEDAAALLELAPAKRDQRGLVVAWLPWLGSARFVAGPAI